MHFIKYAISSVFIISLLNCCVRNERLDFIAVDQVGYPVEGEKIAFLVNGLTNSFELVKAANDEVVFAKMAGRSIKPDAASGDYITPIIFSEFNEPGQYYLRVKAPKRIKSAVFSIEEDPFKKVANAAIQSYFYHRCGTEVKNGTGWGYEICHIDDAQMYGSPSLTQNVTGGWHDAGDYNKFIVNTALSTALLLYLYESANSEFRDGQLLIPENQNGIPDILDEVKWALDWMLKMQRNDGGVYHKVSQKKWIGEYLPHTDPSKRFLFEVSSAATASFAATTALASNIFSDFDIVYADTLKKAAKTAWEYLSRHPFDVPLGGFQNPPDVKGGEYGDKDDTGERIWAALELYRLTDQEDYILYAVNKFRNISNPNIPALSWRDADILAIKLLAKADVGELYLRQQEEAKNMLIREANELLHIHAKNNYKNLNTSVEYYWGSNSVGLANAFTLIQVFELTQNKRYHQAAMDQLHFVLGRNPVNRSQVTGIGTQTVQKPYHQLSELDKREAPIPGMMVGGPNNHKLLNGVTISPYPAKNYEDEFKNYLVNEPAINYTAILAYVSGYLSSSMTANNLTANRYDHP